MRLKSLFACACIALLTSISARPFAADASDEADRVKESATVLGEIMAAPDQAIPESVIDKAVGIAVFPGTVRGGFIIGAERGRGILSARDEKTNMWSTPAFLTITGGSLGLQIGLRATDLILVIQNRRGLENLVRNEFKVGAGAAVTGGPVGRDAQAATDIQLRAEILSYSRSRGLFAGATIEGSTIKEDQDANMRFYGPRLTTRNVVFDGKAKANDSVKVWLDALGKYAQ
ncbi:MAG TPA: lipid-binding SYLF domain-containing protein [Vicinamibacterales bacterium]|nr:lipid-binding SYLF domain-containing protein [Vicinamibacterales bacterium]